MRAAGGTKPLGCEVALWGTGVRTELNCRILSQSLESCRLGMRAALTYLGREVLEALGASTETDSRVSAYNRGRAAEQFM